ncbi:hypothetical protein D9M70_525060 [compost metagenome]
MSMSEGHVRIEKIESGSLFAKISAHPLVVALTTIIVTNGCQYIYNEIDSSKDLSNLKEASAILESTLKIRDFLEENNIDTREIDEEIKKSSTLLVKSLGHLVNGTTELEVNDKTIKTPLNRELTHTHTRQIEHKK